MYDPEANPVDIAAKSRNLLILIIYAFCQEKKSFVKRHRFAYKLVLVNRVHIRISICRCCWQLSFSLDHFRGFFQPKHNLHLQNEFRQHNIRY